MQAHHCYDLANRYTFQMLVTRNALGSTSNERNVKGNWKSYSGTTIYKPVHKKCSDKVMTYFMKARRIWTSTGLGPAYLYMHIAN
jgi:hypothetical protein